MYINAEIIGSGHYFPENIICNDFFTTKKFFSKDGEPIDLPNVETIEKFETITHIRKRRYALPHQLNSDLALESAKKALKQAKIAPNDLDLIILAHNFGDIDANYRRVDIMPSLAGKLKHKLGIDNTNTIPYDMIFGCPGWIQGMILATQQIQSGLVKNALVVGADTLSRAVDPYDRDQMIFGDGAGAVVLSAIERPYKCGVIHYKTQANNTEELDYLVNGPSLNPNHPRGNMFIRMNGRKVYQYSVTHMPPFVDLLLKEAKMSFNQIDRLLIHQANGKMVYNIMERLEKLFNTEKKDPEFMPMIIEEYGNISVACVPILWDMLQREEISYPIQDKQNIIMLSIGAGMHISGLVYKMP